MRTKPFIIAFLAGCINIVSLIINIKFGTLYLIPINVVGMGICWIIAYRLYKMEKKVQKIMKEHQHEEWK